MICIIMNQYEPRCEPLDFDDFAQDVNRVDDLGDRALNSAVMAGHSELVTWFG